MRSGSLRLRMFILAAATIAAALGLTWVAMTYLFERHITARLDSELASQIVWIAANLDTAGGKLTLRAEPPDPRFSRPFGGLYWQVEPASGVPLRSRSLWDEILPQPKDVERMRSGTTLGMIGIEPRQVFVRAENLVIAASEGPREVRVSVAADYSEVEGPVSEFGQEMAAALGIIGLCLTAAAAIQVRFGLAPLARLRDQLTEVRGRRTRRLDPEVPREVRPLVDEVNELLAAQEDALSRARARAGDLAHGLKTPLAVLSTVARDLEGCGRPGEAAEILGQVETMQRRIDRELARARLRTDRFASTDLGILLGRLVELMRRTPRGRTLEWRCELEAAIIIAADDVDAAEVIGNVLENACKWAASTALITARRDAEFAVVTIDDDGPGVAEDKLDEITERGTRLVEQTGGAGLGLAISSEILAAHGGRLQALHSPTGGLRIEMRWPLGLQ